MATSSCVVVRDEKIMSFTDSEIYRAAAEGQIDPFNGYTEPLNFLLTPTKNTILHIHITQHTNATNSIPFLEQILAKSPSLLLQPNNRCETPLHMAARHGHDYIVKFLIDSAKSQHQEDIEAGTGAARAMLRMENLDKETALHEAVRHNHPVIVQILTAEDPHFTYSATKSGETPLYLAAERGFRDIVFHILNTCTSPAYHGPNGRTALHEAALRNDSVMTAKIVETNKTLVKEVDKQGWAPLHHASYFGHVSIVKQLLEYDKSVAYMGDRDGMIPLHLAAVCGKSHKEVVFSILKHCPDCHELVDHKGRNVVHFAVQSKDESLLRGMMKGSKDYYVPSLTNLINQKDVDGNTPIHWLATYCMVNYEWIKHPLADPLALNNNNSTPLDIILQDADNHDEGLKGYTVKVMKDRGYKRGRRNFIEVKEKKPQYVDTEEMQRVRNSHIVVAALIVTVTFTAAFTLPGGYDGDAGTAILSKSGAFVTFIVADAIAFLLSTCALFFYYTTEDPSLSKRRVHTLVSFAAFFITLALFFMLIAFAAAVFAVLPAHRSPLNDN